jgi:hypothetical protein
MSRSKCARLFLGQELPLQRNFVPAPWRDLGTPNHMKTGHHVNHEICFAMSARDIKRTRHSLSATGSIRRFLQCIKISESSEHRTFQPTFGPLDHVTFRIMNAILGDIHEQLLAFFPRMWTAPRAPTRRAFCICLTWDAMICGIVIEVPKIADRVIAQINVSVTGSTLSRPLHDHTTRDLLSQTVFLIGSAGQRAITLRTSPDCY